MKFTSGMTRSFSLTLFYFQRRRFVVLISHDLESDREKLCYINAVIFPVALSEVTSRFT